MLASGQWAKVGSKHYRHASGAEIRYDCSRWMWVCSTDGSGFTMLWAARHFVEIGSTHGSA